MTSIYAVDLKPNHSNQNNIKGNTMKTPKVHFISGQYKYDHTTAYLTILDRLIQAANIDFSVDDLTALRQDYALHTRHFVKRAIQQEVYNAI